MNVIGIIIFLLIGIFIIGMIAAIHIEVQWHKPEEIDFDDEDSDEDELFEDSPAELPRVVVSRQVPSVFYTFKHYKKQG